MMLHRISTSVLLRSLPRANHLQIFAGLLTYGEPVTEENVFELLWGNRDDGGPADPAKQINIYVYWLRRWGWKIRRHHGLRRVLYGRGQNRTEPAWICDGVSEHSLIKYRTNIEGPKKCAA